MMTPKLLPRAMKLLNRPMFGTKVIAKDATVASHEFPEDEFPVFCPQCDYELRGLTDNRCPECGQPFDRGRLLVDQYVRERDHKIWDRGRLGLWAGRLAAASLIFLLLWVVGTHLVWWAGMLPHEVLKPTARQADTFMTALQTAHRLMWWGQFCVLIVLLACVGILLRLARRNTRKRQRVLAAIGSTR